MHRIRHTAVHLQLPQAQGMDEVQTEIARRFRERVLPELAAVMDALVGTDQTLVVPRLAIDLGDIPPGASDDQWVERCKKAVREALEKRMRTLASEEAPATDEAEMVPTAQRTWQAFLFYLVRGRLPWWFRQPVQSEWESDITKATQNKRALLEELRATLRQTPAAGRRLVFQFSPQWVLALLASDYSAPLHGVVEQLSPDGQRTVAQQRVWQQLCAEIVAQWANSTWNETEWVYLEGQIRQHGVSEALLGTLGNEAQRLGNQYTTAMKTTPSASTADHGDDAQAWLIDNAGLVLLAPFVPQLLTQTGIWTQQGFKDEDAPTKAVALLRYLTHGTAAAAEHELTLCKILAGLPIDWPLPPLEEPDEAHQAAANDLLQHAIDHWPALGQCSIAGLRETFLQRPGRLRRREDGQWLLQTERKTVDILLDRLPWGYGIVRLPWMGEMVWVEW